MTREEELEIIVKVRSGDADAFEALVLEHQNKVYSLALRMVGNEEDARDMAQEAFIRAFNSLGSFRGESKFSVWLYRLTSNICIDFLRGRAKRRTVSLSWEDEDGDEGELEIPDERPRRGWSAANCARPCAAGWSSSRRNTARSCCFAR